MTTSVDYYKIHDSKQEIIFYVEDNLLSEFFSSRSDLGSATIRA
jgi:hypothetical protein